MLSERELGIGYLAGLGFGLVGGLLLYFTEAADSLLVAIVGTTLGILLAVALPVFAWWLDANGFPGRLIWVVAQWSAIGLGLTTLFVLPLVLARTLIDGIDFFPSLVANFIAAGAVLGVLFGTVSELSGKYDRTRRLNRQNSVLNRVLRHDIRNDMSVIIAHAEMLRDGHVDDEASALRTIQHRANDVVDLADTVRTIESLKAGGTETVDLRAIVDDRIDELESRPLDVEVTLDQPDVDHIPVDEKATSVVDNLVENAVEHNDRRPEIEITVDYEPGDRTVELIVEDNGPGIPDEQIQVLDADRETGLDHSDGLGLWLVTWLVDHCGGTLDVRTGESRGSTVSVEFPVSSQQSRMPFPVASEAPGD